MDELEQRVLIIERELFKLKSALGDGNGEPWWRQILGEFSGDDDYAEIARLGQELRQSDQPE